MSYEIELKAALGEEEARLVKQRIDSLSGAEGEPVEKQDIYYRLDKTRREPSYRIRVENGIILVTAKQNNRVNGIETNKELEFPVDLAYLQTLKDISSLLGYSVLILKHKTGWSWHYGSIHAELLFVDTLGWFLELEIIEEDLAKKEEDVKKLKDFLALSGVSHNRISTRSYQSMLEEKQVEKEERDGNQQKDSV
jgi:Adenylate cyclase, class 2 (thermophilic)